MLVLVLSGASLSCAIVHVTRGGGRKNLNVATDETWTPTTHANADLLPLGIDPHALDDLAADAISLILATLLRQRAVEEFLLLLGPLRYGLGLNPVNLALLFGGPLLGSNILSVTTFFVDLPNALFL